MKTDHIESFNIELSIIIPVKNEEESIARLAEEVDAAMASVSYAWECIWIDDGSTDTTLPELKKIHDQDQESRHQYISLSKNFGQSAALCLGFRAASGRLLATLDGDGQNDPSDLPALVQRLVEENADMITGIRQKRRDSVIRKISSKIGNGFRNMLTGESITDVGCSIRVFKKSCAERLPSFNGMHRFLPTLIRIGGCTKIVEMPVNHRPREYGQTKYGINNRLWVGIIDTLAVRWMKARMSFADMKSTSLTKDFDE